MPTPVPSETTHWTCLVQAAHGWFPQDMSSRPVARSTANAESNVLKPVPPLEQGVVAW